MVKRGISKGGLVKEGGGGGGVSKGGLVRGG